LARFIYALGIPEVGETTARALANHFQTLKNIQESTIDKLESISDIGPIVAKNIQSFFSQKNNIKIIEKLQSAGINFNNRQLSIKSALDNLSFVITGTLESITREKSKEILLSLGAKVGSTISKNTNYLICGNNPGSKYEKAIQLNIKILDETSFLKILKKEGVTL
jgi:DNA ligase (NAD+)